VEPRSDAAGSVGRFRGSALAARVLLGAGLVVLVVIGARPNEATTGDTIEAFVCDTARAWRAKHGDADDLQLVRVAWLYARHDFGSRLTVR
jgi:hypothetical protein